MNANITEVKITLADGSTKTIKVTDDGLVLIRNGRCSKFKQASECSVKELLINAKGEEENGLN
jgi:hypothetical protein